MQEIAIGLEKVPRGTKVATEMLPGEQRRTQDRNTRSATRVGTLVLITSSKYAKLFTRVGKPQSLEPEGNVKRKHVTKHVWKQSEHMSCTDILTPLPVLLFPLKQKRK